MMRIRVVSVEGLIGLKLQALLNDPNRTRDLDDIRELLRANWNRLNLGKVREYFALFDRPGLMQELIEDLRVEEDKPSDI